MIDKILIQIVNGDMASKNYYDQKEVKMLIVMINDDGKVIEAMELLTNGETRAIEYVKGEVKSIRGAVLYTPNGCCWRKTPQGWQCRPEYC